MKRKSRYFTSTAVTPVLVQGEMESLRAPLASMTPFFGWQFAPPKAGGRRQRGNG